jgi:hypothetical protein
MLLCGAARVFSDAAAYFIACGVSIPAAGSITFVSVFTLTVFVRKALRFFSGRLTSVSDTKQQEKLDEFLDSTQVGRSALTPPR